MAREKFPSDGIDRTMLRFPPGLRDRVAEAARANNRSMNAEIVSTLEEAYPAPISEREALMLKFFRGIVASLSTDDEVYNDTVSQTASEEFIKMMQQIDVYRGGDKDRFRLDLINNIREELIRRSDPEGAN